MSIEKQIEGMRKDLIEIFDEEYEKRRLITPQNTAEKMTAKGYRKQSEWISVEERLPEEDTIVLVWCGECSVYNYLSDNLWYTGYCDITTYEAGVTHWMPLPEPPIEKGERQ